MRSGLVAGAAALAPAAPGRPPLLAQRVATQPTWLEAAPGSRLEEYLQVLLLDAAAPALSRTVRAHAPGELRRAAQALERHPWRARFAADSGRARAIYLLRPAAGVVYNTAFPYGGDDGALWTGRGLTVAMRAGAVAMLGPLTVRLEPVGFRAQNDAFRLFDETRPDPQRYADPIEPATIDQPQRFGARPLQRIDLGDSEVRLTAAGATIGLSSAVQSWGPALVHPLILGTNAPGFPHAFAGTARPLPIGIGRVHGRLVVGRLDETPYSPAPDSLARRLASALVVSFTPRGLPGFEVGGTRFFHRAWRRSDLASAWRVPFEGLLFKERNLLVDDTTSVRFLPDNQLASLFVRWRLPNVGTEVYGEFARNDASLNLRELITQPDHASAYALGLRTLLRATPSRRLVASAEMVNARTTHIDRVRPQARLYQHGYFTQGHTHLGQVLGSTAVLGGSGLTLLLDAYTPDGHDGVRFDRITRLAPLGEGAPSARALDVVHALRLARTRFVGPVDLSAATTLVWELNRDFRRDAANVRFELGARTRW